MRLLTLFSCMCKRCAPAQPLEIRLIAKQYSYWIILGTIYPSGSDTAMWYFYLLCCCLILSTFVAADHETIDDVPCGEGMAACKCDESADVCQFSLEISARYTFTRYNLTANNTQGFVYNIVNGTMMSIVQPDQCNVSFTECSNGSFVDGKSYRPFIAVNGQIPGPTLIVSQDQTVIVNVQNNLMDQAISVHWHGMFQFNTPWMDGVGFVTQCPIGVGASFRYIFKAEPTGTFWYHSHSNTQRTDGLFGGLVVMETNIERDYIDLPENYTFILLDFHEQTSLELFEQQSTGLGFFNNLPIGEIPTQQDTPYRGTSAYDNTDVGPVPYESGLINGRGRHPDVPFENTLLHVVEVDEGQRYRFRVIGGTMVYAYMFSVDGHRLSLIAGDGFLIEPIEPVDFIIVHAGERYEFVIETNQTEQSDYWIRAETLEANISTTPPPYPSLNHLAQAILHYSGSNIPHPTEYANIDAIPRECTQSDPCIVINCPFQSFQESYNLSCINVAQFRLTEPEQTPVEELPSTERDIEQEYFFNFGFDGLPGSKSSINGRVMILPPFPMLTQGDDLTGTGLELCPVSPDGCEDGCTNGSCVHLIRIPYRRTITFVLSSLGRFPASHPIHFHGHSFHVLGIRYGEYDETTGILSSCNTDITCGNDNDARCTSPTWSDGFTPNFTVDAQTMRKDTVIVPAGGYVVIQFVSNNPGYWFMHCHIEVHQFDGMALIVSEAASEIRPPPDGSPNGFYECGDFTWTLDQFNRAISGRPTDEELFCRCINDVELGVAIAFAIVGFIVVVAVSIAIGMVICYCYHKKRGTPPLPEPVSMELDYRKLEVEEAS